MFYSIYLDAEATIIEDFGKDIIESMMSQTTNLFSQIPREIHFIFGSKDDGGLVKARIFA